ncbi:hypothetical protein GW17_00046784, partial [Ensete ventricosum]
MGGDDARALATREQRRRTGEDRARAIGVFFSSFLFFSSFSSFTSFSLFLAQSIADGRNRPSIVDFWRNRLVAGGLRTSNLADRYVPPVPGGFRVYHRYAQAYQWYILVYMPVRI